MADFVMLVILFVGAGLIAAGAALVAPAAGLVTAGVLLVAFVFRLGGTV